MSKRVLGRHWVAGAAGRGCWGASPGGGKTRGKPANQQRERNLRGGGYAQSRLGVVLRGEERAKGTRQERLKGRSCGRNQQVQCGPVSNYMTEN